MRILLLTHAFNSLTQRLHVELREKGYRVAVEFDINDENNREAIRLFRPNLIIAPFLKRRIPDDIWQSHPCFVIHPGIPGDRGPSALDHAILDDRRFWGVTVLQATADLDAGPVWAWRTFFMRRATKSSLYRFEVTEAAVKATLEAIDRFRNGDYVPISPDQLERAPTGQWQDPVRQRERRIDWVNDDSQTVLRKIRSADGSPGVLDELAGVPCRLYDACPETFLRGRPGTLIARRNHAVCKATRDGAVWIGHIKLEESDAFKLPATHALGKHLSHLPDIGLPFYSVPRHETWQDIRYREKGAVGTVSFDFYNGAMCASQCRRLLTAFNFARNRPTRVIILIGHGDFWSNGMDLNLIEAAPSQADQSWRNINAMDDLCETIIRTTTHLVIAGIQGNAGAGGCFLALAADLVMARPGIVLNPHYQNMGNLYGSEYWTYLLPKRAGDVEGMARVMSNRLPIGTDEAMKLGLVDATGSADPSQFTEDVKQKAEQFVSEHVFERLIRDKQERRLNDERETPLAQYRHHELEQMRLNFYGFDPAYHVARYRFVHDSPRAWTPLYLAPHRRLDWEVPAAGETRAIA
ncbi:MAG: hydrogenase maturation protein [Pseudomonadales bacterium]|nr:hydrogenase maturation protein [Pseudomonadales bacterium]